MNREALQPENSAKLPTLGQKNVEVHTMASTDDTLLVDLLRNGDEAAFVSLIDQYYSSMVRLAMTYVSTHSVAEEVVQEAWVGVLKGLSSFEGRSSLKTWIFRILTNCAKTRGQREGRSIPFSSLADKDDDFHEPAVDPDRFESAEQEWPGHWKVFPTNWNTLPENHLLSQESRACLQGAIDALPPRQREVIILRDIEGWTSEETCSFLSISEENQRVLLHRARSKARRALEKYFDGE